MRNYKRQNTSYIKTFNIDFIVAAFSLLIFLVVGTICSIAVTGEIVYGLNGALALGLIAVYYLRGQFNFIWTILQLIINAGLTFLCASYLLKDTGIIKIPYGFWLTFILVSTLISLNKQLLDNLTQKLNAQKREKQPTMYSAEQIKIDGLKGALTKLQNGKTENQFIGITSNGVDCIFFVYENGKFNLEFKAMGEDQLPFIDKLKEFANSSNFKSLMTYNNKPNYKSDKPAPVLRIETNATIDEITQRFSLMMIKQFTVFYLFFFIFNSFFVKRFSSRAEPGKEERCVCEAIARV